MIEKVDLDACFSRFDDLFAPKIVAELNGQYVLLVRCEGDRVPWHVHEREDELFLVVEGVLELHTREGATELTAGQLAVVPRGTEHRVVPRGPVRLMLFEPTSTAHTGDVDSPITRRRYERLDGRPARD